jgi:hypothetical protein
MTRWKDIFVAGAHHPVMGVTEDELRSIKVPTIIIPGNDKVHSSQSGMIAHHWISGSTLHRLPLADQDVPLIPFGQWAPYEAEIARAFTAYLVRVMATGQ